MLRSICALLMVISVSPSFAGNNRCLDGTAPAGWKRPGGYCWLIMEKSSLTSRSVSFGGAMGGGGGAFVPPEYLNMYGSGLIGRYVGTETWNGQVVDRYTDINGHQVDHLILRD